MEPIPSLAEMSINPSKVRGRLLFLINSLGEAYVGQLARITGYTRTNIVYALHGTPPHYRDEHSLVSLALVREEPRAGGRVYAITSRGRRKVRSLAARRRAAVAPSVRLSAPAPEAARA